jgi:hypothetical protein
VLQRVAGDRSVLEQLSDIDDERLEGLDPVLRDGCMIVS